MHNEIKAAASFISSHTEGKPSFSESAFCDALSSRYAGHWYPVDPEAGSAYRCLSAGDKALQGLKLDIGSKWIIWVDPGCVCYRADDAPSAPLMEIFGRITTPQLAPAVLPQPSPAASLPEFASPATKRSRAIQILHPDSRKPSFSFPAVSIAPPTPLSTTNLASAFQPVEHIPRADSPSSSSSQTSSSKDSLFSPAPAQRKRLSHARSNSSISIGSSSTNTSISRPNSACSVTEHAQGNVGVLSGGVMLGGASTSDEEGSKSRRRREVSGRARRGQKANFNSVPFQQWQQPPQWSTPVY